jgi:hypothetical protein
MAGSTEWRLDAPHFCSLTRRQTQSGRVSRCLQRGSSRHLVVQYEIQTLCLAHLLAIADSHTGSSVDVAPQHMEAGIGDSYCKVSLSLVPLPPVQFLAGGLVMKFKVESNML